MAGKTNNTRPIHAPNGPVSNAIGAVREPVAPFFAPVRDGDPMTSGWVIGRRHDWDDAGREEVVWLDVQLDADGWCFGVWRAGKTRPEHPDNWSFTARVVGVRSMPADPLELTATKH